MRKKKLIITTKIVRNHTKGERQVSKKEWKDIDSTVKLTGHQNFFKCHCGCNVFRNSKCERYYKCNSCGAIYDKNRIEWYINYLQELKEKGDE